MITSTHLYTLGLTTLVWGLLLAISPKPVQKNLPGPVLLPVQIDTIPDESFDTPFRSGTTATPRQAVMVAKADSSKIIPVVSLEVDSNFVKLREIPKVYSGFKIELMMVESELPNEHDLFFQHGNLSMEVLPDSTYSYTLGTFEERPEAERFLNDLLIDRYPDARVIEYQKGERTY